MAKFSPALTNTLAHEGGWSRNTSDRGGETYCGISRNAWPDWAGWKLLDTYVYVQGGKVTDTAVRTLVEEFYLENFWTPIRGDSFIVQGLANYVFDCAVNHGVGDAAEFLQEALVLCGEALEVDGVIGKNTLTVANRHGMYAVDIMKVLRGNYYLKLVSQDESQRVFLRGWLRRAFA